MHLQMMMCCHGVLLGHFATAAQKHACFGLCGTQRGEQVCFGAADVSMAGVVAGSVACVVGFVLVDVGADVGMALVCAVWAVSVGAVHAACVAA